MGARTEIEAIIKLRDEFSAKVSRIDKRLGGMEKSFKRTEKAANRLKSTFGALGGLIGGAVILRGLKNTIQAIDKQVGAINALNLALANQGNLLPGTSESLREYAAGLQRVTTFGDEAIIELQALLAGFGQNEEQIKRTTAATLDFATAQGIDLKAAALLLGKAFVGETGTLSRYGIILEKNIPKTEKFDAVISQLTERFGGAAQAQTATFSGQLKQLGNSVGDLQEGIGSFIGFLATSFGGSMESTINVLGRVRDFFTKDMVTAVGLMRKAMLDGFALILEGAANVGEAINTVGAVIKKSPMRVAMEELGLATKDTNIAIDENVQFLRDMAGSMRAGGVAMIEQAEGFVAAREDLLEFNNVVGGADEIQTKIATVTLPGWINQMRVWRTESALMRQEQTLWAALMNETFTTVGEDSIAFGEVIVGLGDLVGSETARQTEAWNRLGLQTQAQSATTLARLVADLNMVKNTHGATMQQIAAAERELADFKIEISGEVATAQIDSQQAAFDAGMTALGVFGQRFKAAAIAEAVINALVGITRAFRDHSFPASVIIAASVGAAAFATVAKITGVGGFREGTANLDFQDFGPESAVRLHGREAVIPQGGGASLAGEIASALGSSGSNITNNFEFKLSVRTLATDDARLSVELAPAVNEMLNSGRLTTEVTRTIEGIFQKR